MTCYYNDRKATEEVLRDGWLCTGDMAMQDEDGFYFLVDRLSENKQAPNPRLHNIQTGLNTCPSNHP